MISHRQIHIQIIAPSEKLQIEKKKIVCYDFLFLSWQAQPMPKHLLMLETPPVVIKMHNIQMKP